MSKELIIDCFAGGGGAYVGIEMALGRPVDIAINHDPDAILMHKTNHPNTLHLTREWFYLKGKPFDKVMELLMDCMTGTDTPKAQIRRYAEDILIGRAALKGNTADGTYHLETYEPGEEEELPSGMNVWKIHQSKKALKSDLDRMTERFNVTMEHLSEGEQRAVRKELGEETNEDREQARLDSFITRILAQERYLTEWNRKHGKRTGKDEQETEKEVIQADSRVQSAEENETGDGVRI